MINGLGVPRGAVTACLAPTAFQGGQIRGAGRIEGKMGKGRHRVSERKKEINLTTRVQDSMANDLFPNFIAQRAESVGKERKGQDRRTEEGKGGPPRGGGGLRFYGVQL